MDRQRAAVQAAMRHADKLNQKDHVQVINAYLPGADYCSVAQVVTWAGGELVIEPRVVIVAQNGRAFAYSLPKGIEDYLMPAEKLLAMASRGEAIH
jgi:hypothetical protein